MEKEIFINREISWLAFNERVLQEAKDLSVPLIDRLKFLGIFSNNLDEFFRVRVASIKRTVGIKSSRKDVYENPKLLLEEMHQKVIEQQRVFEKTYADILKELKKKGVVLTNELELSLPQKKFSQDYFKEIVRPSLVPLMLSQVKTFPYLKDKSIYFAIKLSSSQNSKKEFALLEIPTDILNRFIEIPSNSSKQFIILLDDLIRHNLLSLFSTFNYDKAEAYTIKLTRDAELDLDNDVTQSFIDKLYKSVKNRQKGSAVRLVYDKEMPIDLFNYLLNRMKIKKSDNIISGGRYHNFKDFMKFPTFNNKELNYPRYKEVYHPALSQNKLFFDVLQKQDILIQYPYQTFSHYIDFLREAAIDPNVKSIKMTLYRAAKKSRVINALISAARNGKKVTVVLELQARFDEEANIKWGKVLEEEGIKVIYGIPGLKIHAKLCLIERVEGIKKLLFANISTGNYNEDTAHTYSDHALFTSSPELTSDVLKVFDYIQNPSRKPVLKNLVLSPYDTRDHFIKLINNEIRLAKKGKQTGITLKMNSLVDESVITKLYAASKAGVKCKLIIRGICRLKAGVKGLSENIEAISIIDRFLEHSRLYRFENGGKPIFYISSCDFMPRNLDVRIEVSCKVNNPIIKVQLQDYLDTQWKANVKARILDASLVNTYRKTSNPAFRSQMKIGEMISKYKN
jgi:polyphosphate kinase